MLVSVLVCGLIIGTLVAGYSRDREALATSVLLACNWFANTAACSLTGLAYPYWWFMAVDYITGLAVVLFVPLCFHYAPSRWQIVITVLYAAQLVWHVAYMRSPHGYVVETYSWWFLYLTAWLQLLLVGTWGVAIIRSNVRRTNGRLPSFAFERRSLDGNTDAQA